MTATSNSLPIPRSAGWLPALAVLWLGIVQAQEPPAALFFNQTGIQRRVVLSPPPATVSGDYRLQLVEVDRLSTGSQHGLRLLVRVSAVAGELPDDLVVIGPAWAMDDRGRRLPVTGYECVADGQAQWLAISVAGEAERLAMVTAAVGRRPRTESRTVSIALSRLGEYWRLPEVDKAIGLALVRRESIVLPLLDTPQPLYRGLESTAAVDLLESDGPFVSLRLYTLEPLDDPSGWRLANLRWRTGGQQADAWRYSRRLWRPDWGGWLGASGREQAAAEGQPAGVVLEQVRDDGPAAKAGLQAGDLLVAMDGLPVVDAFALGEAIRMTTPGTIRRCEIRRDGRRQVVAVTVGDSPLWPELDPLEFSQAWSRLSSQFAEGAGERVLSLWDWQTCQPVVDGELPDAVDLVLTRPAAAHGTTFVFSDIPTSAAH